ncbi:MULTISPECIES: DUF7940 domain-containing protein [Dickeya]|uniref:Uncharacterized protein n=1 Tax=Dickeya aquatica TaxID=1401087 RepID=A0A375AB66_9GAMM|nr:MULTISPECIES: hypothetical protein [Dickeya]SLM63181.1 hypothetical protein DAQ1742_02284 [Dickeya aquatica]
MMMELLSIVVFVLVSVLLVLLCQRYTSLEFVSHVRLIFKTWSFWLCNTAASLGAIALALPDQVLQLWSSLPAEVKAMLPQNVLSQASVYLLVLGVISQFIRQQKLLLPVVKPGLVGPESGTPQEVTKPS